MLEVGVVRHLRALIARRPHDMIELRNRPFFDRTFLGQLIAACRRQQQVLVRVHGRRCGARCGCRSWTILLLSGGLLIWDAWCACCCCCCTARTRNCAHDTVCSFVCFLVRLMFSVFTNLLNASLTAGLNFIRFGIGFHLKKVSASSLSSKKTHIPYQANSHESVSQHAKERR